MLRKENEALDEYILIMSIKVAYSAEVYVLKNILSIKQSLVLIMYCPNICDILFPLLHKNCNAGTSNYV